MSVPLISHPARSPAGPWRGRMRLDLATTGVSAVHWTRAYWNESQLRDRDALRGLLGREWDRFALLPGGPRRELFAVSRLLLKHAAALALQTEPEYLELGYTLYGRPFVRGWDEVDVSLSHSGGLVVVAVTTRGAVGVDIEPVRDRRRFAGAESQFCTAHERELLRHTVPAAERDVALMTLWTLKEAYTKALGLGLRLPFHEIGFTLGEDGPRLVTSAGAPVPDPAWSFRVALLDDTHRAALALRTDAIPTPADQAGATSAGAVPARVSGASRA